jgi:phosphoglycolate phosphatase
MSDGDASQVEIIRPAGGRAFRCALVDFDGTISLIRQGWQSVMIPLELEVLGPLSHGLGERELTDLVREDIDELTGKQTIHQMIRLAERAQEFGATPADPAEYKTEYNRRLMFHVADRRAALADGRARPEEMMLRGARAFLTVLRERGVKLYLASGTDQPYVEAEAALLGVAELFDGGIHGARADYRTFSKAAVIRRMLSNDEVDGSSLLGIGDGFVEIAETRRVGGYAVGVASDEAAALSGKPGLLDAAKRSRLLDAGADLIVPDFAGEAASILFVGERG